MKFASFISLFFLMLASNAQIASVSTDNPQRGAEVIIRYTPDTSSVFDLSDEVYVQWEMNTEDFRSEYIRKKMIREGDSFIYKLMIDPKASLYEFGFFTPTSWDRETELVIKLKDESGKFFRNANMALSNSLEGAQKERELYPDNYALDFQRWRRIMYASNQDSSKQVILSELESIKEFTDANLGKKRAKFSSESALYATTVGYLLLNDFENAFKNYDLLLSSYPGSNLIEKAHSSYSYYLFSASKEDPKFEERSQQFLFENPTSAIGKRLVWALDDSEKSREQLYNSTKYWMENEPDEVTHYYMHAKSLDNAIEKKRYLGLALNKLLDYDLSVTHYYSWRLGIPRHLVRIIEGYVDAKGYGEALGLIEMYESNSSKKNVKIFNLKGKSFQALHNYDDAFEAFLIAESMGDESAGESAIEVFEKLALDTAYEDFKEETLRRMFYEEEVELAPDFSVTDMDGNEYQLSELKGKVVVLNFWFIGCAPCIVEMPGLNELVAHYEGKDVVFIAFALDSQESLDTFLERKSFAYQVIPSARDQAELYGVSAYPTHVIIDKKGNIRSLLTGGSKERHKDLIPQIDNALKF